MLIALDIEGERVTGNEASKEERYFCQQCNQQVIVKKGEIKTPHFAHYPDSSPCVWWEPETEEHLLMKQEIMELLKRDNDVVLAEFEHKLNLNSNILFPDVYLELANGKRIAIECQVSNKPFDMFLQKTELYSENNIYTLWIFPLTNFLTDGAINDYHTVPIIQRQSHTWNWGRIYTLDVNALNFHPARENVIIGVHLKGVYKRREKALLVDGYSNRFWLTKDGHENSEEDVIEIDYRPRTPKETFSFILNKASLLCIENDGMKIARFYDKKWWGE